MNTTVHSLIDKDSHSLASSWLDAATVEQAGIFRVDSAGGADYAGRKDAGEYSGLVFPVYQPGEDRPREYILRRDRPDLERKPDGTLKEYRKYLMPPGRGNILLLGPRETVADLADPTMPVLLVEGVKKLYAGYRLARHGVDRPRFLSCAINGVWGWRGTVDRTPDSNGHRTSVKGVSGDFDRLEWSQRQTFVLYDSDTGTNPDVVRARAGLVQELQRRGARVVVADIPLLEGTEKTGFDDLLATWGPERVLEWLEKEAAKAVMDPEEATLDALARLSPLQYDRVRKAEAKKLGVSAPALDQEIQQRRKRLAGETEDNGRLVLADIEPAEEPVDGLQLMAALTATLARYVVMLPHALDAVALWVLRAHAHELFDINPRLVFRSPEKGCGKTTCLELLEPLLPRALMASNISPAAIFRVIEAYHPALLIDEMDTFTDSHEELRGILNSGHRKAGANVIRTVGDNHEPRKFSTWCPMVFAAIGSLPGTLEDRSLIIPMQRKRREESAHPLYWSRSEGQAIRAGLSERAREMARWVQDHAEDLVQCAPTLPAELSNRIADNWFPLFVIADVLGGDWPERARQAALALSGQDTLETDSIKVRLLQDIQGIFVERGVDRLGSESLCDALVGLEEGPWGEWTRGKPLTQNKLAGLLRPFGVRSRTVRLPDGWRGKGYTLDAFQDAFARYISSPPSENPISNRDAVTTRASQGENPLFQSVTGEACHGSENGTNPAPRADCHDVTLSNPESGGEEVVFEEEPDAS